MEQYDVTGMSCAACQAHVEKAVSKVPGVESCSVSLLTNSMGVEGSASPDDIIKAVEDAGYGASLRAPYSAAGSGSAPTGSGSGQTGSDPDVFFQNQEKSRSEFRNIHSCQFPD